MSSRQYAVMREAQPAVAAALLELTRSSAMQAEMTLLMRGDLPGEPWLSRVR